MTITRGPTQGFGKLVEIVYMLNGNRAEMERNARAWKALAQSQGVPAETLAAWINNAASTFSANLGIVPNSKQNAAAWAALESQWVSAAGGKKGDFDALFAALYGSVVAAGQAAKASHADIIAACDAIIAAVTEV